MLNSQYLTLIAVPLVGAALLSGCKSTPPAQPPSSPSTSPSSLPLLSSPLLLIPTPSANFDERKREIDTIVLHYTAASATSSLRHMCNPLGKPRVSAHYMVDEGGIVFQLVPEDKRAWHAGAGSWKGRADLNSASIGIEIVNPGRKDGQRVPYPDAQIDAVIQLCREIQTRHTIKYVIGHSDLAIGRKEDPGEHFPWKRLAESGVGIWTDDFLSPVKPAAEMLREIGYDPKKLELATQAFQRHYYPEGLTPKGTNTLQRLSAVYNAINAAAHADASTANGETP